jgi:hypothetical protein
MKQFYTQSICEQNKDLSVRATVDLADREQVAQWLEAEHFLGNFKPVGHTMIQIVEEAGRAVAVLVWGASAYRLKDREAYIGWDAVLCAQRRNLIVNNVRFLIRDDARRPNLASQALAVAVGVLSCQWREQFGYQPLLAETFTDPELHAGTCYKAAGWEELGLTEGNSRHRFDFYVVNDRPKRLWLKPLRPDFKQWLCAPQLAPEHIQGQTSGAGARCALKIQELCSLAQTLRKVPDPRANSIRFPIGPILTLVALGLLMGKQDLAEIVRAGQRLSQIQRQRIGLRLRKGTRFVPTPCYNVYGGLLKRINLDCFASVITEWLSAHRGSLPATLAMDGKCIRARLGQVVTLLDIEEKVPVAVAADTRGKGYEAACARKLLESVPLLNTTIIADSLHTNAQNAQFIVQEKGGDYIAALKDNQPNLHKLAYQKLDGTSPLLPIAKAKAASPTTASLA